MISPPPYTSQPPQKQLNNLVHNIVSYDSNIMLAAIISLLLVILFVLLLHVYAKWFLGQAARQGTHGAAASVPQVLSAHFHHFHTFALDNTFANSPTKGLDSSLISSIPLFVYHNKNGILLECVICLSVFENDDVGRRLPKCNHAFHVECVDKWLHSHATCPICRAPVISDDEVVFNGEILPDGGGGGDEELLSESTVEIVVEVPSCDDESIGSRDSCSSSIGASLKRMMSRCEQKLHPSAANAVESSDVLERE